MQNKHRTELVPARGSSQPSASGQPGAPGLSWGSESNPQLDLPITPNTEQIKQEASFRELNNLPFPAVRFSNWFFPSCSYQACGWAVWASWDHCCSLESRGSLFPVSSGRQRCLDKRKLFQWFIVYIILEKFSFLPSKFSFSFSTLPWLLP